jgi:hypothetical protein
MTQKLLHRNQVKIAEVAFEVEQRRLTSEPAATYFQVSSRIFSPMSLEVS